MPCVKEALKVLRLYHPNVVVAQLLHEEKQPKAVSGPASTTDRDGQAF